MKNTINWVITALIQVMLICMIGITLNTLQIPAAKAAQVTTAAKVVDPADAARRVRNRVLYAKNMAADAVGERGKLMIPELGIGVLLAGDPAKASDMPLQEYMQNVVDEENTALLINSGSNTVVMEHRHQTFYDLPKVTEGTEAVLIREDGTETHLICTGTEYGSMTEEAILLNADGEEVFAVHEGEYIFVTCAEEVSENARFYCYWSAQ